MFTHCTTRVAAAFGLVLLGVGVRAQNVPASKPVAPPISAKRLPPGGVSLFPADALATLAVTGQTVAPLQRVPIAGQPFNEAARLTTLSRPTTVYAAQFAGAVPKDVKKGDTLLVTFYVRTVKGSPETGEAQTQFVFERGSEPYTKAVEQEIAVPAQGWKRFDIPFKSVEDLPAGTAKVSFRLGYDPQVFEIGGLSLINFGPNVALADLPRTRSTYTGQEAGAAWRKKALARIERIRKAALTVRVVDNAGRPISNAQVSVRMTRHAFPFGSAVTADWINTKDTAGEKYRQTVTQLFNEVVFENDLKWYNLNPPIDRAKQAVAWLHRHNIAVRGHNLVWPSWGNLPRELQSLKNDKPALAKAVTDHVTKEATSMRGLVVDWDVVNEPYTNHDLQDILGPQVLVDYFELAKAADPKPRLYLNDYPPLDGADVKNPHLNGFEKQIRYLLDNRAPLEGIGFQGHFGGNVIPPARVLTGFDRFAKFNRPILITEFDISTNDEQLQADYTRDFLIAAFSHPACAGVIQWGFWEGAHWKPDAALFRRDWSIKPNGKVYTDLVLNQWWTKTHGKTSKAGTYQTRGFLGDYKITATVNGKTQIAKAKLTKIGATITIILQ